MRSLRPAVFPLAAASLLACGLVAALRLLQERASAGGSIAPATANNGRRWAVDDADALLAIDRHGQYYFNRTPIRNATLPAVIDSAFGRLPAGTPLYVYADRSAKAGMVDAAVRAAQARGVRRVSFIADAPPARWDQRRPVPAPRSRGLTNR